MRSNGISAFERACVILAFALVGCSSSDAPTSAPVAPGGGTAAEGGAPADGAGAGDAAGDAAGDGGAARVPTDGKGIRALRVADMMEILGANIYSNKQDGASGETVQGIGDAVKYLVGDSGLTLMFRAYVDAVSQYDTFGPALSAATGGKFTLAMGIGDTPDPTPVITLGKASAAQGGWVRFVEGGNEPNTNFGAPYQTGVAASKELPAVQSIYAALHPLGVAVASASVVGDFQGIAQYWGGDLAGAVAASDAYNAHLYPNHGGPNGANQLHDWSAAISQSDWQNKPGVITEWQPVLFNAVTDDASCAYFAPIMLLSAFVDFHVQGLFWWGLFDYAGFTPHVGLFRDTAASPYPAAKALRAMFQLTGDTGQAKHTFTPGQLDVTVTGLPRGTNAYDGGRFAVFQNSSGAFFVFVWNEASALDTATTHHVTVTFGSGPMTKIVDYSLTNPTTETPAPKQTVTNASAIQLDLTTEVRVLQVTHP